MDAKRFPPFAPGTLWSSIVARTRHARERHALQPFDTIVRVIEDHGVAFQVRAVTNLERRPRAAKADAADPLLPPDPDLLVAGVTSTHVCVLNKYPVLDHHVLVVTRRFEPQESALRPRDFAALWRCLREYHALGFYNAGPVAGASQPHKHLQVVPLPLAPKGFAVPIDAWLQRLEPDTASRRIARIPFRHAFRWLLPGDIGVAERAAETYRLYRAMLADAGLDPDVPGPYNLIVAPRYLLLVPRVRDGHRGVSVNALGFAGSFFVTRREALDVIEEIGPVAVLRHVTGS